MHAPSPRRALALVATLLTWTVAAGELDLHQPVQATHGMVASQDALATRVGVEVLRQGGNAVDAAVAVGFALAVTLPQAGNLGGGGFMVLRMADGREAAIDFREMAPAAATRDMFLDEDGEVDNDRARFSHLSAGVPGSVAGLALAQERYGSISLAEAIAPAIELAEHGFEVGPALAAALERVRPRMEAWPASLATYFKPDGSAYRAGERLVQPELADTLSLIAVHGPSGFYSGSTADRIAAEMARHGGLITREDLAAYRAVERAPVRGHFKDHEILSMPPPSSGGTHIVQILNVLEQFTLGESGHNSAASLHVMAEAMRMAYADRSEYLGDPDYVDVPVAGLTSSEYARALANQIKIDRARPSSDVRPGDPPAVEPTETTHYSVVDAEGNAVAVTTTLNFSFGSGIVVPGTGMLLNNEMDDFAAKPGVPNAYGLIGGDANAIEPGKRPLSSMSPTVVLRDGRPFLVTGSPGGSRIITTTLQIIVNVIEHDLNIAEATHAPRMHHQWLPDELFLERGVSPDTARLLRDMGHVVTWTRPMGSTQSILIDDGTLYGASDPRTGDGLTAGY